MVEKQISEGILSAREQMNMLGRDRTPFLFVLDFALKTPLVQTLDTVDPELIRFDINGFTNASGGYQDNNPSPRFQKTPVSLEVYRLAFEHVMEELRYGNSFLLNLTFGTPVQMDLSLQEIFMASKARYKLCFRDEFVVFSPEKFIEISDGRISAFPMKGTIDASLQDAYNRILDDPKEKAEHITIVDLLRNDLSMVARDVRVERFRFIDEVRTHEKTLLQVSSEISGLLPEDYRARLGDILYALLPAGSVSGAPKKKTVEILSQAESHARGYFTGVFGYFDGDSVDSGVMIRYIEKQGDQLIFKSGGGITTQSRLEEEYQEMIDKVYVPIY